MGIASTAPVSVLADQFQTKSAITAEITKQNAQAERNVANIVEASAQNLKRVSPTGPGVGGNIDRSV